jgi:hypothetical protein
MQDGIAFAVAGLWDDRNDPGGGAPPRIDSVPPQVSIQEHRVIQAVGLPSLEVTNSA